MEALVELARHLIGPFLKSLISITKYILAGGIGLQNILQAKSIGPWCLDINSMIETEPGVKSIDKAKEIFKLIADV